MKDVRVLWACGWGIFDALHFETLIKPKHTVKCSPRVSLAWWAPATTCMWKRRYLGMLHSFGLHGVQFNFDTLFDTVEPVYNDHLMGYFSAFWSSFRWPKATHCWIMTGNNFHYSDGRYRQVSLYLMSFWERQGMPKHNSECPTSAWIEIQQSKWRCRYKVCQACVIVQ